MKMTRWMIIALLALATPFLGLAEEKLDALSPEQALVEKKLSGDAALLVVAVNGMCCRTCAIGIGKKVCQLDFVDTEVLPKGVAVDRENSLLTVSVIEGEAIDVPSLVQAIHAAGYDPVRLYQRDADGTLQVTDVSKGS